MLFFDTRVGVSPDTDKAFGMATGVYRAASPRTPFIPVRKRVVHLHAAENFIGDLYLACVQVLCNRKMSASRGRAALEQENGRNSCPNRQATLRRTTPLRCWHSKKKNID